MNNGREGYLILSVLEIVKVFISETMDYVFLKVASIYLSDERFMMRKQK